MTSRFTPPPFEMPLAATRIYDRIPEWKFHTSVRLARSAISNYQTSESSRWTNDRGYTSNYRPVARYGEIWVYSGGKWFLDFSSDEHNKVFVDQLPWKKKNV